MKNKNSVAFKKEEETDYSDLVVKGTGSLESKLSKRLQVCIFIFLMCQNSNQLTQSWVYLGI